MRLLQCSVKGQLAILKMAAVRPYLLMDRNRFRQTHLDIERIHMQGFDEIPPVVAEEMR